MGKIMTHHRIFWESMRVPQINTNPNCKIIMAIFHREFMMNPSEFGFNDHRIIIFQNYHLPMNSSHHESRKVQISCIRIWGSVEAKGGAVKAHGHMMVSVLEATHPQGSEWGVTGESLGSHLGGNGFVP